MADFFTSIASNLTTKKVFLILVVVSFCVYFNSLFNGFVWDDEEQIVNNTIIQSFQNFPQILSGGTFSTGGGTTLTGWFFRPFLSFILMFNFAIWGTNPFGFHLFQMLLHTLSGCLVFLILQRLTNLSKDQKITTMNLLLSALFIVHPAINEAVVYISAVSDSGYTTLVLIAFTIIVYQKHSYVYLTIFALALFLSLLTKESTLAFFPILYVYLFIFRSNFWKKILIISLSLLVTYLVIRLGVFQVALRPPEFAPIAEANLFERLLTLPAILSSYLTLFFYPSYLSISQHFVVKDINPRYFWLPLIFDALFVFFWLYLAYIYKNRVILFGFFWFFISFGLISNIFPLDMTIAERWFYLPIIGIIIGLAAVLASQKNRSNTFFGWMTLLFMIIIVIFGIRTIVRNSNWINGLSLYSHDQKITKNSYDLENNLGVELFKAGKIEDAKAHFEKSIELQPNWHFSHNNLGAVYQNTGDKDRAMDQYQITLKLSDYYLTYENLAFLLLSEDPQKAREFAQKSLLKLPNNSNLWRVLAISEYKLGNQEQALKAAKNAYLLEPSDQNKEIYLRIESKTEL